MAERRLEVVDLLKETVVVDVAYHMGTDVEAEAAVAWKPHEELKVAHSQEAA